MLSRIEGIAMRHWSRAAVSGPDIRSAPLMLSAYSHAAQLSANVRGAAMRASSLSVVGIAIALISIAPANAQTASQNIKESAKRDKTMPRQVKDQAPVQIYCYANIPCRPVKKGCHLEHIGQGGFNEEICN
jgi:hypothetical protein